MSEDNVDRLLLEASKILEGGSMQQLATRTSSPKSRKESLAIRATLNNAAKATAEDRIITQKHRNSRTITPITLSKVVEESGYDESVWKAAAGTVKIVADTHQSQTLLNRGQWNWRKLRRLLIDLKTLKKLNSMLVEKDLEVEKGCSARNEIISYRKKDFFKDLYINPNNRLLTIWKLFFQFGIVFTSIMFSYRLAFGVSLSQLDAVDIIGDIIDISFLINIILNFLIAIKRSDNTLITNKKVIAKNYIYNGTFFIDIIALIPYEFFASEISGFKLLRLVHLTHFFVYARNTAEMIVMFLIKGYQAKVVSKLLGEITTILLFTGLSFHLITAAWIAVGFPGVFGEKTWFYNMLGNNQQKYEELSEGNVQLYIDGLFYVAQSVMPVGYGSSLGYTDREYILTMAMQLFGMFAFVAFFVKIRSLVASVNQYEDIENEEVEELKLWLRKLERGMVENCTVFNQKFLDEIKALLYYRVDNDWQEQFQDNENYSKLDHKLQSHLLKVRFAGLQEKFRIIFQEVSPSFFHELITQSQSMIYKPSEVIINNKDKRSKGIYLIQKGSVFITGRNADKPFLRLAAGSFFGETSILPGKSFPFQYIAESELSCLFIDQEEFLDRAGEYSEDMKRIRALAYERQNYFMLEKQKYEASQKTNVGTNQANSPQKEPEKKELISQPQEFSFHGDPPKEERLNMLQESPELQTDVNRASILDQSPGPLIRNNTFFDKEVSQHGLLNGGTDESKRISVSQPSYPNYRNMTENFDLSNSKRFYDGGNKSGVTHFLEGFDVPNDTSMGFGKVHPTLHDVEEEEHNNPNETIKEVNEDEDDGEDDEEDEDNDELNDSGLFPLEGVIPDFQSPSKAPKIINYLEVDINVELGIISIGKDIFSEESTCKNEIKPEKRNPICMHEVESS